MGNLNHVTLSSTAILAIKNKINLMVKYCRGDSKSPRQLCTNSCEIPQNTEGVLQNNLIARIADV
jgi:hypothetical protein